MKNIFHIPPKVKTALLCLFIITTFVLLYFQYQERTHRFHRRFDKDNDTTSSQWEGTITEFTTNQAGDVDGFILDLNNSPTEFNFPSHTALSVMASAPIGNKVKINARKRRNHYRMTELWNETADKHLDITDIMPSEQTPQGEEKSFMFPEHYFVIDKKGRVMGIANDKIVALFKPQAVNDVMGLIKSNSKIRVSGIERSKDMGYVNRKFETIIHTTSIQIDGNAFILQ